ncbi:hypothetical protein EMCRGX_G018065 [Ephydatia muelleri]
MGRYSPRRSLYSGPNSFVDSDEVSPEIGLQNAESFYGSAGGSSSRICHIKTSEVTPPARIPSAMQALEADKGTCTSEAPVEPAKRKRRTPLCLQSSVHKLLKSFNEGSQLRTEEPLESPYNEGVCKTSSGIEVHY